jgi:predicted flap endonuclease-1-like 5' DNA nuclease
MNMAHENSAPESGLDALTGGNAATSTVPTADAAPSRPPLSERIIALPPPKSMEAFRTKVKVKVAPNSSLVAPVDDPVTVKLSTGDDLTRIRGIDATLAGRLAAIGVAQFAQIATWEQSDVQTISQLLDLGRTISRQNWIEQAALLQGRATPRLTASVVAQPPRPVVLVPVVLVPVVPVPVVPVPVVPVPAVQATLASVVPDAPAAPVIARAAVVPPQPAPSLPRVVSVDSPGDAKFHQAAVQMGVPTPVRATLNTTPLTTVERVPPRVPVPIVPAHVVLVPIVPVPVVMARSVAAAMANTTERTPFRVPVPVVPELVALEHAEAAARPPSLPAVPVMAEANQLDQAIGGGQGDSAARLSRDRLSDDDILETQLHDAVAAAADDRAVAATVDLLSAFSPPPTVADGVGSYSAYEPATQGGPLTFAASLPPDAPLGGPEVAFTRWVPPTPLVVPTPPPMTGRAAEAWSPMPSWSKLELQGASQAGFALSPVPAAPAIAATHGLSRPRDRWGAVDHVVPELPQSEPHPQPDVQTLQEPMPLVPLEPVAPTMLDRLASLEAELTALAANDQPRAHAAVGANATVGVPQLPYRSAIPVLTIPVADLVTEPNRLTGRRAGVRPDPAYVASRASPVPAALDSLDGGEADVTILPRGGDQLDIRAITSGPTIGTLEQRMRRARPAPEVDVETYAGYHASISEASVEIVRRDTHTRATVFSDHGDATDHRNAAAREGSVRKFFKALKGDAN